MYTLLQRCTCCEISDGILHTTGCDQWFSMSLGGLQLQVMFCVDKALTEETPAGVSVGSSASSDEVLPVAPPGTTRVFFFNPPRVRCIYNFCLFYFCPAIIILCMLLFLGRTHFPSNQEPAVTLFLHATYGLSFEALTIVSPCLFFGCTCCVTKLKVFLFI